MMSLLNIGLWLDRNKSKLTPPSHVILSAAKNLCGAAPTHLCSCIYVVAR